MLKIYNSLTKKKEIFQPLVKGKIGIYVCGMTVYDYCHLGHARTMVCFDVITRYLRACGFKVNHIRNITDIDDKIINRANDLSMGYTELTEQFIQALHEDEKALGILPPDAEPKATAHIDTIIRMIQCLLDNDIAYIADNGDVYYSVDRFAHYGQLAHKDIAGQQAGARVDIQILKRNPLDFVLWKQAKPNEPSWPSPWGEGRPGWHIECSAMSTHCLGDHFDIHGGGADLKFPHHENEIAQSEATTGKRFVNTWMHVGFLQINEEKMSKSLGNFFTIREVLKKYSAEVIRYFLLSSQYRSQLSYSIDNLDNAKAALERLYISLRDLAHADIVSNSDEEQRFQQAMEDDFNTPEALAVLFDINHKINQNRDTNPQLAAQQGSLLKHLGGILGLLQDLPQHYLQGDKNDQQIADIQQLINSRWTARQQGDWNQADRIRDQLHQLGIELEDTSEKTLWRLKK